MQNRVRRLAFVGSTGAGKTTITNLINRFYDIQDGKIRYDGININKDQKRRPETFPRYRSSGYYTCLPERFVDNIRYGKLDATDEEMLSQQQNLPMQIRFIQMLPEGYDTMLKW